ncbi:DEAD/DEAH box helicase [Patescibacteria group bacterium]|nr:DEAD/DEAH box helicase [Patescibacteria group bacterium]
MFKKNYGRSSSFGKPNFGKPNFRRGGGFGKRGNNYRNNSQPISISRFVCKAQPVTDIKPYESEYQFVDFLINDHLKKNISKKGYVSPTPIQDKVIPLVLNGSDVVGVANTGTGKTAAFLIPLINKVLANPNEKVLIVVPTRELASQINAEFMDFRGILKIFSACCVGGMPIRQQISSLRQTHNFVIGTPGRLKDLTNREVIKLSAFGTIVLDEADRMLDMGFIDDMRFIMSKMANTRQTLLFSATITSAIDKLINEFLREPINILVKTSEIPRNIDQDVVKTKRGEEKIDALYNLLSQPDFNKVLIFGRTKNGVEELFKLLIRRGFKAEAIHGDKNQPNRQRALSMFKSDRSQILVATDVAARGLDIPNVSHVINYDIPATYKDYIHRIGRTGRADKVGKALTFID